MDNKEKFLKRQNWQDIESLVKIIQQEIPEWTIKDELKYRQNLRKEQYELDKSANIQDCIEHFGIREICDEIGLSDILDQYSTHDVLNEFDDDDIADYLDFYNFDFSDYIDDDDKDESEENTINNYSDMDLLIELCSRHTSKSFVTKDDIKDFVTETINNNPHYCFTAFKHIND